MFLPVIATDAPETPPWAWGIFGLIILGMLALDLLLFNKKAHVQGVREAAFWCGVWVALALGFNVGVYYWKGEKSAVDFTTAYLVEQALSVDNLFIFIVIFRYFGVPTVFQHRVLFWGVFGAQVMRGIMIFAGVGLINQFHFLLYIFGGILVLTGIKMFFSNDDSYEPEKTLAFRITRRYVPLTPKFHEEKFFVREAVPDLVAAPPPPSLQNAERGGIDVQPAETPVPAAGAGGKLRLVATPLFLVLVIVESTDLIFAVDSIPACLAITQDPFVVYTSNIFAVMGLRSYYFLLAGMMGSLRFLKPALSVVLVFIGVKMIVGEGWGLKLDNKVSLGIVAGILVLSVAASLLFPPKPQEIKPLGGLPSTGDEKEGA